MPKIIELTVEIEIQRVSCPGVWLCQDGRVSLTVFALGTSYQTCLLPPIFPLMFKDIFYFRKRFQETCALNNICCLLKDETIYCELVQWCNDCTTSECTVLAQYLGVLSDVLFPPNMCSNDGVDLLMRRSKDFPGILSPKIEIATKVRIDEVWNQPCNVSVKPSPCSCSNHVARNRQVCHTSMYHRSKCNSSHLRTPSVSRSRSRSRSRSVGSRSHCSLTIKEPEFDAACKCTNSPTTPKPKKCRRPSPRRPVTCQYNVYNVETADNWINNTSDSRSTDGRSYESDKLTVPNEERLQKMLLQSRLIDDSYKARERPSRGRSKVAPCVCHICKRYHELFHST